MAVISNSGYMYLFILNPRTACTAISKLLVDQLDGRWIPAEDVYCDGELVAERKHTTLHELIEQDLVTTDALNNLTVVTGVRNPFDSLVSLYSKIITKYASAISKNSEHFYLRNGRAIYEANVAVQQGFNEWMTAKFTRARQRGTRVQFHERWMLGADVYLRFEHLEADWKSLCDQLAMPHMTIPVFNQTKGRERDYRLYYNEESRATVEEIFAPTLEHFGYEF